MSDRFFLDTNIIVYTFDPVEKNKSHIASELLQRALATRQGVISYQVVQEFFHVALRRFATPPTIAECEQYLSTILQPMVAVHSSPSLYFEALRLRAQHQLAWYDSLIVAAAIQSGCQMIYSEDFQDGQQFGGVRIQNPFIISGAPPGRYS